MKQPREKFGKGVEVRRAMGELDYWAGSYAATNR